MDERLDSALLGVHLHSALEAAGLLVGEMAGLVLCSASAAWWPPAACPPDTLHTRAIVAAGAPSALRPWRQQRWPWWRTAWTSPEPGPHCCCGRLHPAWRPHALLHWMLPALGITRAGLAAGATLGAQPDWARALLLAVLTPTAALLLWLALRWGLVRSFAVRLPAMITRVPAIHSSLLLVVDGPALALYGEVQRAAVARVLSSLWPAAPAALLLLAAFARAGAAVGWALSCGSRIGRPRDDDRPG
jgi:hypothetical protein